MEIGLIILAVGIVLAAAILVFARPRAKGPAAAPDPRLDTVLQGQATIAEQFRHSAAAQATMTAQVDALKEKLAESLAANAQKTGETFVSITERLTVIDTAQKNITELSGHVVSLRAIFSDKQARGAISQDQMEAIVAEHLAPDQYEFQATLSNGKRPDCLIRIPNVAARIVVDSKFPLEAFEALRDVEGARARHADLDVVAFLQPQRLGDRGGNADGEAVAPLRNLHRTLLIYRRRCISFDGYHCNFKPVSRSIFP